MQKRNYNSAVHWLALITATATFPLIFMGGLVTSHQAGMSVPDWPNSWGYNMFTFPPSKWVGGILYEHTHRLFASGVGLLSIIMMVTAWATGMRPSVRWTSVGVFLAVLSQGIIGGLRVVLSAKDLAIVHGCAAQLLFCFIAGFCVMTSRFWTDPPKDLPPRVIRKTAWLALLAVCIIVLQLIVGALMRHNDAGLAIPDFPTSYGHMLPPTSIDPGFRQSAIHRYGTDLGLNRVTLFQIWIHFAHRVGAVLVTISVIAMAITVFTRFGRCRAIFRPALAAVALLAVQLTLGILTVLLRKPADIASAHVAVGSLLLVTTWVIALRALRIMRAATNIKPNQDRGTSDLQTMATTA